MTNGVGGSAAPAVLLKPDCWHRALNPGERGRLLEAGAPAWALTLARALNDFPPDGAWAVPPASELTADPSVLAEVVKPLVRHAEARLARGIHKLLATHTGARHLFDVDLVMPWLLAALGNQLWPKLTRTVALEANVARLEGRLAGSDPGERFRDFLAQLAHLDGLLGLLTEYPVLARQLVHAAHNWIDASLEILSRLCGDLPLLAATFDAGRHPGHLTGLSGAAGDTHRGNRAVVVLSFDSGLKLVYKPKPMAVDVHFQQLLRWINERQPGLDLRVLTLLNRGRYGWCEYVNHADCSSPAGVAMFYRRLGAQLALLYALEATDFHCENLIACGEHPVLVDLESLFHPRVEDYRPDREDDDPAIATIGYSALRVGILPQREGSVAGAVGLDMTATGGRPGQLSPRPIPTWADFGTDEMHIVNRQIPLRGAENRPRLAGSEVVVSEYIEDFIEGFRSTYEVLGTRAEELLTGPLARFSGDEVRVIVRSTKTYSNFLRQSFHPDLLRDAEDRHRYFQQLWRAVEWQPYLTRLVEDERADLLAGDIPIFTTRTDTRDLYTSRGEVVTDFFEETGLDMVSRRIRSLSPKDLERQVWFIRASFAAIPLAQSTEGWRPSRLCPADRPATKDRLVGAAKAVADRLTALAVHQGDSANWVGLSLVTEREWQLRAAEVDLYSGTPGIVLFLAYAGAVTGDGACTDLARRGLQSLERQQRRLEQFKVPASIGAFTGLGSSIYLLSHLGALWNDPSLVDEAERLAARLAERIGQDTAFDIMTGAAGSILALLSLHALRSSSGALPVAMRCGDHLLGQAQPAAAGLGWINPLLAPEPLTGFSHGTAGIAYSLLKLGEATDQSRFRDAGMAGLAYEQALFSPEAQNWPDLRSIVDSQKASRFLAVWCHGAAGIGLGRLGGLAASDTPAVRGDIAAALRTTLKEGFGLNHCLCHGDLGALDLLLVAAQVLGRYEHACHLESRTAMVLDSIDKYGWLTGLPRGVETPGLIAGLAGIGYQLLRLAHPEQVPSVLLLAPPVVGRPQNGHPAHAESG